MTTAAPSTALATIQPAFTDPERLALAGFLAGYRGLTREAYALDLRQFSTWCRTRSVALFAVRRADIEGFARGAGSTGPRLDYESHATALDRNELGALLVAASRACADLPARAERPAGVGGHRR
jgi:integrase/recombinase XerD